MIVHKSKKTEIIIDISRVERIPMVTVHYRNETPLSLGGLGQESHARAHGSVWGILWCEKGLMVTSA
jgi:hypothetical protein